MYAYEDLSPSQFENLVVALCQRLLGHGVMPFAEGPDGGRDGKFVGTANLLPSEADRWKGTVIIQAKHTNGHNRSCSESDFFREDSKTSTVAKEALRVQKMKTVGAVDHYLLITNRRLPAQAQTKIEDHLSSTCNIQKSSIMVAGVEKLEMWLRTFPQVATECQVDPIDSPLLVRPEDLAEVVEAFADALPHLSEDDLPPPPQRTPYDRKNELNDMPSDFAKEYRERFLKDSTKIREFLADPQNGDFLLKYEAAVDEFQSKVLAHRKEHHSFDKIINYLVDLLFNRDPVLRKAKNKRLTRLLVFYMYWTCDLGVNDHATAN